MRYFKSQANLLYSIKIHHDAKKHVIYHNITSVLKLICIQKCMDACMITFSHRDQMHAKPRPWPLITTVKDSPRVLLHTTPHLMLGCSHNTKKHHESSQIHVLFWGQLRFLSLLSTVFVFSSMHTSILFFVFTALHGFGLIIMFLLYHQWLGFLVTFYYEGFTVLCLQVKRPINPKRP